MLLKKIFLFCAVLLLLPARADAIDIIATGVWNQSIGPANLVSGPGSALTATYTSSVNATVIDVSSAHPTKSYTLSVSRQDGNWNPAVTLSIRRTSEGTGSGSISGGTTYIPITGNATVFFTGVKARADINCQYQITGVSLDVDPGTLSTTVVFTVVN